MWTESMTSPASRVKTRGQHVSFFALALLLCCAFASSAALAQNVQYTQGDVGSGLENSLQIPLRAYPGRGAASLPITLYYTSKVWRMKHVATYNEGGGVFSSVIEPKFAEHSAAGWSTSLGLPEIEWPESTDYYNSSGKPVCLDCRTVPYDPNLLWKVSRLYVHLPDGSTHELRKSDQPYKSLSVDMLGTFYAIDGSRLRYDGLDPSTPVYLPDGSAASGILYMPDGARYILGSSYSQFIDRNGNTLNFSAANGTWTDTLGRAIATLPVSKYLGATDYSYDAPGVDGTSVRYTFRWRYLHDVLTNPDPDPNKRSLYTGDYYLNGPPSVSNPPQPFNSYPTLFWSDFGDGTGYVVGPQQKFDPVVLYQIELPNHLSYTFTYNLYGEIDKVTYPTGSYEKCEYQQVNSVSSTSVPYSQADRGIVTRRVSATGSSADEVQWHYTAGGDPNFPNTFIISTTAPDQTRSLRFLYYSTPTQSHTGSYYPFGYEDAKAGLAYEERFYSAENQLLRRVLRDWAVSSRVVNTGDAGAVNVAVSRNPRPTTEVSLILDTGTPNALAKTVTYGYDYPSANEFTTGLNRILMTESYFGNVAQSTAQTGNISAVSPFGGITASIVETTYINSTDANYSEYQSRNILGLIKTLVLEDGQGNPVSKTETFYDDVDLQTYNDLNGTPGLPDWTDPGAYRGNVTRIRRYLDPAATIQSNQECPIGVCLETRAYFDQVGNVWKAKDVRGIEAQTVYSATYKHAYPTLFTSADPDGTGPKAALTTTTVYDSSTGLVTSTWDANNQETKFSYKINSSTPDPLNRLRRVDRPDGSFTTTDYHDSLSDITGNGMYVETKSLFDTGRTTVSRQYSDKLGRSVRSFAYEGTDSTAPWLVTDTYYDPITGRVQKVSNPYRTSDTDLKSALPPSCSFCTSSEYDALGRVTVVTLPDGATVQTEYQGNITTVTDQAGKRRRQETDALGRIVQVDEPDSSGNLTQVTSYEYNTLGGLIHVQMDADPNDSNHTVQHRYFSYDALGRLTYERQVEQDANTNFSFTDPLSNNSQWTRKLSYDETIEGVSYKGLLTSSTDARTISTTYHYDDLNRPTLITYDDGVTPAVRYFYDEGRLDRPAGDERTFYNLGRLTEVQTDAIGSIPLTSQAYNYDLMGRVANNQQTVGTNSYTMLYRYYTGGALKSEQYPSGRVVSYTYDNAARLSGATSGATIYVSDFKYDSPQGMLTSVTLGNGTKETFDYYSDRMQLKELGLVKDGNTLQRYVYKYGQADTSTWTIDGTKNTGQIAQIESYIGTSKQWRQEFGYDRLGRLKAAVEFQGDNDNSSTPTYLMKYDYDRFGNRYQRLANNDPHTVNPLPYVPVEYSDTSSDISKATNRYTFSEMGYDPAGNVTTDGKFTLRKYTYDANNRQRSISALDNTLLATSVYDGSGQRVASIANGTTSIMVYDAGGKLVAEYGEPLSPTGGTNYIFSDQQGSTRVVTSQSGGVLARHDYQPFGEEIYSGVGMRGQGYGAGDAVRQKFAGMEKDEASGMSHTLWRQYDSLSGRWTAPDPYGGSMSVGNPQSFNRYSYVDNDPVNLNDPSGLAPNIGYYYREADLGWEDVSGSFWGRPTMFNVNHHGGPQAIAQGRFRREPLETRLYNFTLTVMNETAIWEQVNVYIKEVISQIIDIQTGQIIEECSSNAEPTVTETGLGAHEVNAKRRGEMEHAIKRIVEIAFEMGIDTSVALGIGAEETWLGGGTGYAGNNANIPAMQHRVNPLQLFPSTQIKPSATDMDFNIRGALGVLIGHGYFKNGPNGLRTTLEDYGGRNTVTGKPNYGTAADNQINYINYIRSSISILEPARVGSGK